MPIECGIFDHRERIPAVPLQELSRDRLEILQRADRGGFTGYPLAERHGTHRYMAPQQAVFLAAAAQVTERIRIGPLVSRLPTPPSTAHRGYLQAGQPERGLVLGL